MTQPAVTLDAHGKHAQAVCFTADGLTLISVGQDAAVRLWSVPDFAPRAALNGHAKSVNTIALAPRGDRLATSSSDGSVRLWTFPDGRDVATLEKQQTSVFSPDGRWLATVNAKQRVVLWDGASGAEHGTLPEIDKRVTSLAFAPDGESLLVGGAAGLQRFTLPAGPAEPLLQGPQAFTTSLTVSPDGRLAASTHIDTTLRLWSTRDWKEKRSVLLKKNGTFQLAFTPRSDRIAVSTDGAIYVFGTKDLALTETIDVRLKGVYGIAISPDGRFLANAAADGRVRIWEIG
jgi:WD40 repeat protein